MIEFSENLKRIRESRGLTKSQIASKLNLSLSAYSYYETGRKCAGDREPALENLIKLAAILKVSVDELLGYHVDEFERCKNLWVDAGVEIEVTKRRLDIDNPDLFADYTSEDYKKGYGLEITLRKRGTQQTINSRGMVFLHKEEFINFTKKIEKKCQIAFKDVFKNAIDFLFTPLQNSISA